MNIFNKRFIFLWRKWFSQTKKQIVIEDSILFFGVVSARFRRTAQAKGKFNPV